MCKDDHEEKNAKFGGDTTKKVMNRHENSFRRFGREVVRRSSVFSKYVDAQH